MVRKLSDDDVDINLACAIPGYDSTEKYPEWSNAAMREAYRAGYEDAHPSAAVGPLDEYRGQ